jgi:hypothetical protein
MHISRLHYKTEDIDPLTQDKGRRHGQQVDAASVVVHEELVLVDLQVSREVQRRGTRGSSSSAWEQVMIGVG